MKKKKTIDTHIGAYMPRLGGCLRARCVGSAQAGLVPEELNRAHKPDPFRSSLAHPRPLVQRQHGPRPNRVDPHVPRLEDDFHLASLTVVLLGLQEQ